MTGIHGCGVRAPHAAAVADATCGFIIELHMPNDAIFAIGLLSIMFPIGLFCTFGLIGSVTENVDGAAPKLH